MGLGHGRNWSWAASALVAAVLLGACTGTATPAGPTPAPYGGPLWTAPDSSRPLHEDPGAAGRVVTCDQPVLGASSTNPFTGGEVRETPEAALQEGRDEGQWSGYDDGEMRAVRSEADRVLFTYVAGGRTLQAVVMRRGPAAPGTGAGADGIAWWMESFARCDVVEYPDRLAESLGYEVWNDAAGRRVSSQIISSSVSDGDCLAKGTRTLELPDEHSKAFRWYLSAGGAYRDHVGEPYRDDVALPADAVDSGYSHGDERLWFSPDQTRAYVGGPDRVALWPRETEILGCG